MAKEITLAASLSFTKGAATETYASGAKTVDVAGDRYIKTVQIIGTSAEAIVKGEIGTLGFGLFKNLDAANFVTILMQTGDTIGIVIKPGEVSGPFRLTTAPFAKADTAPVAIEFMIVEN